MTTEEKRREDLLYSILIVQSKSKKEDMMRKAIKGMLATIKEGLPPSERKLFKVRSAHGNIYVTKGKPKKFGAYPCVVSHTDTVHSIIEQYSIHKVNGYFYAMDGKNIEQVGTGGDDKCGIFVTLEMLKAKKVLKAAFFCQEEIGLIGSGRAPAKFFKDCGYALQCDRKGQYDFVNEIGGTTLYGESFSEAIQPVLKKYKREEKSGGSTDVKSIKAKVDICVANMSCAYYEPHSDQEVISIWGLMETRDMVSDLIDTLGDQLWSHKHVPKVYESKSKTFKSAYSGREYGGSGYGYSWSGNNGFVKRQTAGFSDHYTCAECFGIKEFNVEHQRIECPECIEREKVKDAIAGSEGEHLCGTCNEKLQEYDHLGTTFGWCWRCMDDHAIKTKIINLKTGEEVKDEDLDDEVDGNKVDVVLTCDCGSTEIEYMKTINEHWCRQCFMTVKSVINMG